MMNDRFKFRAWNKLSNEMKDVIRLNINYDFPDCSNVVLETNTFDAIKTHNNPINCSVGLKNVVIMQCTGLKDKNGKLIYEGDILLDYVKHIRICVFEDGMFKFPALKTSRYYSKPQKNHRAERQKGILKKLTFQDVLTKKNKKELEVIGNIYENPELLQECE